MRKNRWIFWGISLGICCIILLLYNNIIPYEERTPINVYCPEQLQADLKKIIEKDSSFKNLSRVVFIQDEKEAELVITDKITKTDSDCDIMGYSPLIIALDTKKIIEYKKHGYLVEEDNAYTIDFSKVIEDTLAGSYNDTIYCPNLDTRQGELFYDFLLITFNGGTYPKRQQLEACQEKADEFLETDNIVLTNTEERIRVRKFLHNEIDIIFENEIFSMNNADFEFEISYPKNTVIYEYFCKYQGKNKEKLKKCMHHSNPFEYGNRLENLMYHHNFRCFNTSYNISTKYAISKGFSYIAIPLKEE